MGALIDKLFPESQANAIRQLWEDKKSHLLIEKEIGKKLIEYDEIIDELPLTQLMLITSLSSFANSENECHNVASILYWGLKRIDILPLISEHNGKDLAYRCLISLGLFKKALVERQNRHGCPAPHFYRQAGIESFKQIGMNQIGSHFYQWENFIGEIFV